MIAGGLNCLVIGLSAPAALEGHRNGGSVGRASRPLFTPPPAGGQSTRLPLAKLSVAELKPNAAAYTLHPRAMSPARICRDERPAPMSAAPPGEMVITLDHMLDFAVERSVPPPAPDDDRADPRRNPRSWRHNDAKETARRRRGN
jgi:hypothetical protein